MVVKKRKGLVGAQHTSPLSGNGNNLKRHVHSIWLTRSFSSAQTLNDAARGHHDRARQLRVHEKWRLPAHALRRTRRRSHHPVPNQDRFQSREHSRRDDHGQQGVRAHSVHSIRKKFVSMLMCLSVPRCWSHTPKSSARSSQPYTKPRPTSAEQHPSQPRSR